MEGGSWIRTTATGSSEGFNEPVLLPEGPQLIGTRLIFKKKRTADGQIEHYKARLVAQCFLHTFEVDFFDTYAPVAR